MINGKMVRIAGGRESNRAAGRGSGRLEDTMSDGTEFNKGKTVIICYRIFVNILFSVIN